MPSPARYDRVEIIAMLSRSSEGYFCVLEPNYLLAGAPHSRPLFSPSLSSFEMMHQISSLLLCKISSLSPEKSARLVRAVRLAKTVGERITRPFLNATYEVLNMIFFHEKVKPRKWRLVRRDPPVS